MTAIATFFLQLNFCFYYLLSDDMPLGPLEHVGDAVSVWRFIVAALGIDAGWVVKTVDVGFTTWYISVLMLCYVIFCLIIFIAERMKVNPAYMYGFMVLVGIAINTYNIDFPFFNAWSARGYYAFFAGLLLATYHKKQIFTWEKIGSLIIVVGVIVSYLFGFSRRIVRRDNLEEAYILTFVLYPAIITITKFRCMKKIFRFKILEVLGQCSFDVYIWHVPILILIYNLLEWWNLSIDLSSAQCMVFFAFIVWIMGIASHFFIENKIQNVLFKKLRL